MKSSKIIDISKASLVSLKAELSRKHEEVSKAKTEAKASFIHPIVRNKKVRDEVKKDIPKEVIEKDSDTIREDEELHRKSRTILEAKAKLYDQLTQASSSQDEESSVYLVDFEQKILENKNTDSIINEDNITKPESEDDASSCESDDEWIDYTDCLGRTRRCLKCDLDFVKEKDEQLAKSLGFYVDKVGTEEVSAQKNLPPVPTSNDIRIEQLRQKWEQQEELLKEKKDIHYQDVLFDEARSHGVGYFSFAQDEGTRRQQQEALTKLREDTKRQQEAASETRRRRAAALKARVRAARNRQRARAGLPPEPEEEIEEDDSKEKQEEEERKRAAEMEADRIAKQEEEFKKSQILRPWDAGKDKKKPFEEMSQEDWVKKKRGERYEEFAPPQLYHGDKNVSKSSGSNVFDEKGHLPMRKDMNLPSSKSGKSKSQVGNSVISISEDVIVDVSKPPPTFKTTYPKARFSSEDIRYKVQPKLQKIVNEVTNPIESSSDDEPAEEPRGRGIEIAPPASCEYYGLPPIPASRKGQKETTMSEIEKSISVGLKYLRNQQEKKERKMEKSQLDFL